MLRVVLNPSGQADLARLPADDRNDTIAALRKIPAAFGRPHAHSGIGLRQLRPGIFEARVGLALRAVFIREADLLLVDMIGSHDDVRAYLKRNR